MLLLGKHAADFLPVLLGSDGSLYCVLQGEYAGALRTVHVDDQGRLSAFVIDSADAWDQMLQVGNAELAARLGSLVRFDRRGSLLYAESFEHGKQQWTLGGSGSGYAFGLAADVALTGGYSLRLTAPLSSVNYVLAQRLDPYFLATSFGASILYYLPDPCTWLELELHIFDGAHLSHITVRLDYANSKIKVYNQAGAWVEVAAYIPTEMWLPNFRYLKIVGDVAAGKYIRLLSDDAEYDLSAVGLHVAADLGYPRVETFVRFYGPGGAGFYVYVDDVVVTVAET